MKFSIYDWDGNSHTVDAHDFLGSLECSLGEVVAAPNKKVQIVFMYIQSNNMNQIV